MGAVMDTIETLNLIVSKAPTAARAAIEAIEAHDAASPLATRRTDRAALTALRSPFARWTDDEREAIVALLVEAEEKTTHLNFRVTIEEKDTVLELAASAGMSTSDFIRYRLGLLVD